MGGGTILILLLSIFSSYNQHFSQGINLVFFLVVAIVSCYMNKSKKVLDKKVIISCWFIGGLGCLIGGEITNKIDDLLLRKIFGIFLLIIAVFQIIELIKSIFIKNEDKL